METCLLATVSANIFFGRLLFPFKPNSHPASQEREVAVYRLNRSGYRGTCLVDRICLLRRTAKTDVTYCRLQKHVA